MIVKNGLATSYHFMPGEIRNLNSLFIYVMELTSIVDIRNSHFNIVRYLGIYRGTNA